MRKHAWSAAHLVFHVKLQKREVPRHKPSLEAITAIVGAYKKGSHHSKLSTRLSTGISTPAQQVFNRPTRGGRCTRHPLSRRHLPVTRGVTLASYKSAMAGRCTSNRTGHVALSLKGPEQ